MYEEEEPFQGIPNLRPAPDTLTGKIRVYIQSKLDYVWDFVLAALVPVLQLIAFLGVIVVLSVIFNIYLRRVMVPKALLHERVYFNYVSDTPNAKIKLHVATQQWNYVKEELSVDPSRIARRRFLKADSYYNIHGVFTVAKSARNYHIGASGLTTRTVDASNETAAESVRALVIPYQHPISLWLESVVFFPYRMWTYRAAETVDVYVDLINNYHEPGYALPPTDSIEMYLNKPLMDMSHAYITVMPRLFGVVYYMYYYPWATFLIGCVAVSIVQICVYTGIGLVILALRYFFQAMNSPDPLAQQYLNGRRRAAENTFRGANSETSYRGGYPQQDNNLTESPDYSVFQAPQTTSTNNMSGRPSVRRLATNATTSTTPGTGLYSTGTHRERTSSNEVVVELEMEADEAEELIDIVNADLLNSMRQRSNSVGTGGGIVHRYGASNTTAANSSSKARTGAVHTNQATSNSILGNDSNTRELINNSSDNNALTTRGLGAIDTNRNSMNMNSKDPSQDVDLHFSTPRSHRHTSSTGSGNSNTNSPAHNRSSTSTSGYHNDNLSSPSSTPSTHYSEHSENDSSGSQPDDFVRFFENDFLNRFFPFLSRKGSTFGPGENEKDKKDR